MKRLTLAALSAESKARIVSPNSKNNEQLASQIKISQGADHLNAFRLQEKERKTAISFNQISQLLKYIHAWVD